MAIPDFQTLMLPTLRLVAERDWRAPDLIERLSSDFGLTQEERRALLPSGRQATMSNRVHWALTYLSKAGLATRVARGTYAASGEGRRVLAAPPDRFTIAYLGRFAAFQAFRSERGASDANGATTDPGVAPSVGEDAAPAANGDVAPTALAVATPMERLEAAAKEINDALAAALLLRLRAMPPDAFERLLVDLLLRMGFGGTHAEAGRRLGRSGDGGVDGVIREDALGLDLIYIQAKRYGADNTVGSGAIREFAGALLSHGARKGVFATTSGFTRAAKEERDRLSAQQRIVLIDGDELARLMIEHEVGVRVTQTVKVHRLDLDPYEDDDAA